MASAACPKSPNVAACGACNAAAAKGICSPTWGWDWHSTLKVNDAKTSFSGVGILRGMQGRSAEGVTTVAHWNQSNWPGMVARQPARVRAVSTADRAFLCRLWSREHSYQSFPVLLGCRKAQEFEDLCSNEMAVVRIPCAAIDLSGDATVAGAIYDSSRWWRVTHSQHPPKPCANTRVTRMSAVATALSVYPRDVGHFVPEQLPKVLLLHAHLPSDVPILVADAPAVRRYLQPLIDAGVMPPGRILFQQLGLQGSVLVATHVYTVLSSHFSNVMSGDVSMLHARAVLERVPPAPTPMEKRTHILVIDRSGAKTRRISNHAGVLAALRRATGDAASALDGDARRTVEALPVRSWRPNMRNMSADIAAWRGAALVVAPHGAGLANMLFASAGTPVIEICYDDFGRATAKSMACPAMYAAMAVNLHLPYWVVTAAGSYATSSMSANLTMMTLAATQALHVAYGGVKGVHGAKRSQDALRAHSMPQQMIDTKCCGGKGAIDRTRCGGGTLQDQVSLQAARTAFQRTAGYSSSVTSSNARRLPRDAHARFHGGAHNRSQRPRGRSGGPLSTHV